MNREVKDKWVAALKSGEYKQGPTRLKQQDNGNIKHCCLGVLCELAKVEGVTNEYIENGTYFFGASQFGSMNTFPTSNVFDWSGLENYQADVLAGMNDNGWSFDRIADYIQERI